MRLLWAILMAAQIALGAPAILFTDITSGPVTGGPGNLGAPITIYGTGFGAQRAASRVTIGGVEVAAYLAWGAHNAANPELDKIIVQPGPSVTGGDINVIVDGRPSNGVAFAVRQGRFLALSAAGNDSAACSLQQPCRSVARAASLLSAGDFLLIRGGTYSDGDLTFSTSGREDAPISVVPYPGENVFFSARNALWSINASHFLLGGLQLFGARSVATSDPTAGVRLVGNIIGNGASLQGERPIFAGNLTQFGPVNEALSCLTIAARLAWIASNQCVNATASGISINSGSAGIWLDGNRVAAAAQSGIETTAASYVTIRNSVFTGNNHAGVRIGLGTTEADLRHNTFFQNGLTGAIVDGSAIRIRNNIFFQTANFCASQCTVAPLSHSTVSAAASAVAIEWNYYQTPQPVIYGAVDSRPVTGNLFFADTAAGNYRLLAGSAAIDTGLAADPGDRDADGRPRPQGSSPDLGAYELAADGVSPAPQPEPEPAPQPEPSPQPSPTPSAPGAPVLFFTDIESGPATGGEANLGAIVTLYGRNFGTARGASTVTIAGTEVAAYKQWGAPHLWYEKISIQLGPQARTGDLIVTVNGTSSNALRFTVRPGNIYFLAPNGNDANDGGLTSPWRNAPTARDRMRPGDLVYLLDGFTQSNDDGQGWNTPLLFRSGGSADAPLSWLAYPGATATLGSVNGPGHGIRFAYRDPIGHLTFAGIRFRGSETGALVSGDEPGLQGMRFVGNDFEGRRGTCFLSHFARNLVYYGNLAHDCGRDAVSKELEHGVYFSTDSNGVDMAWSEVANIPSCRGVQVHSSPLEGLRSGFNQYGIRIHHNYIHDTWCDGIVLATVDPSKGAVEVYNNLLVRAAYGTPIDNHGFFSCLYSPGYANVGATGSGTVEVYNNTMIDCGNARAGQGWTAAVVNGDTNARLGLRLRNNIITASPGVPYSLYGPLTGNNNLLSGGPGVVPAGLSGTVTGNPTFRAAADYRLAPASPAIDAGTSTGISVDFNGDPRLQGAAIDLGAFEFRQ